MAGQKEVSGFNKHNRGWATEPTWSQFVFLTTQNEALDDLGHTGFLRFRLQMGL